MNRQTYRCKVSRVRCQECDENITRGMPVVYVAGLMVHKRCEYGAELATAQTSAREKGAA